MLKCQARFFFVCIVLFFYMLIACMNYLGPMLQEGRSTDRRGGVVVVVGLVTGKGRSRGKGEE